MIRSNCCQAPITPPGWPESDFCSKCGEHCDVWDDKEETIIELMAWIEQQRSGMKHLLENYINPNSTAGEVIKLSLERLEKILK